MAKNKSEVILPDSSENSPKTPQSSDATPSKLPQKSSKTANFKQNIKQKIENMKKKSKKSTKSAKTSQKNVKLYANYSDRRKAKKEAEARRRAEDLATLPKEPVKRFFARLHPKRIFKWWFSWRGQKAILKFIGICVAIGVVAVGGLLFYCRKDLDKKGYTVDDFGVYETANTYLDRNGVVLWKDTGSDDYRLVVKGDEIADYMYDATIAIEDKNFYNHPGFDFLALIRAIFFTVTGQSVQGGSTLTQQLVKQKFFADEAASANRGGIIRKVEELMLSIELEQKYEKSEIITMYLNQSPYGGRRNGVESAAKTYFDKSAKDLTLAESALLAGIPNNPSRYNPYNTYYNEALVERQHKVLDSMVSEGYITKEEAEEAKAVDILATIRPESNQYADALAPHFVLEVRDQLEQKYGIATMRAGGWTITTTLDYRAQKIAEEAVTNGWSNYTGYNHSDNAALVSLDVETSQVIAMVGSVDFSNSEYGELNVTTDSLIEPGSSIKPILDYSPLFMQREGINYGPGTILKDENINSLYCAGYTGSCSLSNATNSFYGNVTIRFSLGHSLNIAAVKALYINGIDNSLEIAHALGDVSYCDGRTGYGLSIAIGSGCGIRMVEHANAYASLARGGSYKDITYVLKVENSDHDIIEEWVDTPAIRVVDEQVAYMISSILSDGSARFSLYAAGGSQSYGFVVPGVWTATKTGTTTTSNSAVTKDSLIESYSTAVSTFVWNGNHDGSGLSSNSNAVVRNIVGQYMERVHAEVYTPDGKWHSGDQPIQPTGMKRLTVNGQTDIWPSWYNADKNSGVAKETLVFNRYNHYLASTCTPEAYKIEIEVTKTTDPMTGQEVYTVPEPYDKETTDPCTYTPPTVSLSVSGNNIIATIKKGSNDIYGYTLYIDDVEQGGIRVGANGIISGYTLTGEEETIKLLVSDTAGYTASDTLTISGGGR